MGHPRFPALRPALQPAWVCGRCGRLPFGPGRCLCPPVRLCGVCWLPVAWCYCDAIEVHRDLKPENLACA